MCLHFPMVASAINKEGVSLDMVSGPFKCHFGALMWPRGTLKKSFNTYQVFEHFQAEGVV